MDLNSSANTTKLYIDAGIYFLPTKKWALEWIIIVSVYLMIIAVLSVVGNVAAIVVLSEMKKKNKKSIMNNQFLLSLCVADMLVGLLVIPCTVDVVIHGEWRAGHIMGIINAFGNFCFCISSIVHLALLSVDRYIAVALPLRYSIIMSSRRGHVMCIIAWIYSSFWALFPGIFDVVSFECFIPYIGRCLPKHWTRNPLGMVFTVCVIFFTFGISAMAMCVIYIRIYRIIRRHKKTHKTMANIGRYSGRPGSALSVHHATKKESGSNKPLGQQTKLRKQTLRSKKGIGVIVVIISLYLVAWTPFCSVLFKECITGEKMNNSWSIVTMFIGFGNSACNPLIYCLAYRKFRQTLFRLFKKNRRGVASRSTDTQRYQSRSSTST